MTVRLLTIAALAALGVASMPASMPVAAQSVAPPPAATAQDYTDAELKSFAAALMQVHRINDAYLPKLQSAKTPEEQQQVQQTASDEMVQAVKKEGMTVDQYHQILARARTSPEMANRINEHLKDAATK